MQTDAKFDLISGVRMGVSICNFPLHGMSTGHGSHHGPKFRKKTIPGIFENAPQMQCNDRFKDAEMAFEDVYRDLFVSAHKSAEADSVSHQNSGKASFHFLLLVVHVLGQKIRLQVQTGRDKAKRTLVVPPAKM